MNYDDLPKDIEISPSFDYILYEELIQRINKQYKESAVEVKEIKLYLNSPKKYNLNKLNPFARGRKLASRFNRWWHQDSTQDIKDLLTFIIIHGLLLGSTGLFLLMLLGVEHWMIYPIQGNLLVAVFLFFAGAGSAYYLMLDINSELYSKWGKRKVRK
jgi:hypothetical protein